MGYSEPINKNYHTISSKSILSQKSARCDTYITSYYKRNWGFCLSYNDFIKLTKFYLQSID